MSLVLLYFISGIVILLLATAISIGNKLDKLSDNLFYKVRHIMATIQENKDTLARVVKEVDEILALVQELKDTAQPIPGVEDFLQVNKDTLNELADKLNAQTPD